MRFDKLEKCGERIRKTSGNNCHASKFLITMRVGGSQMASRYRFDTANPKYEVVAGGLCVVAICTQ